MAFNATPMVDVIFMLTIFFMLVTRFSSAEQVPMELPEPTDSQAQVTKIPERVLINCRLADVDDPLGRTVLYSVGPNRPEPLSVISDRLAAMKGRSAVLEAVVRAVMRVIAENGIKMLNVVARVAEDE